MFRSGDQSRYATLTRCSSLNENETKQEAASNIFVLFGWSCSLSAANLIDYPQLSSFLHFTGLGTENEGDDSGIVFDLLQYQTNT
jgi:hypothetical protein